MPEERITERTDLDGNVERTIERGEPTAAPTVIHTGDSGGGSGSIFMMLILVVALVVGAYFIFGRENTSEINRDNAVAEAAGNVGDAAEKVGESVEKAVDNIDKK